ncbi:MAG: cadherin-like beta sandwich domain-containing protein, partial [Oscillospiraceae bacterium]
LVVKGDENINNDIIHYNFFPQTTEYGLTVPYETKSIIMTPTTTYEKPKEIRIKASTSLFGQKVESGKDSTPIKLEEDKETVVTVEITAQDGETKTIYTYKINKETPSSDATLIKLTVTGVEEFKPAFKPSETSYTAKALEGTTEVTVTPTATNKHSTIWIGKEKIESGATSKPINILEEQVEVVVEVTAQDGRTKNKYIVNISNPNAIEKTSNADLRNLVVNDGDMLPKFGSSITNYNVAVSDDSYSVQIVPTPSDKHAKVQVFQGSKEIGDEKNIYKQSIEEGENKFTVKVTSSDETKTKEYNIFVNKNVKDKEASYKPVTPDDVNFKTEDNIIVINIEKHPIITSEVFIEMRDNYPEKTLVLQGNDYSLQFKGSDLSKNIPHQLKYDFKLFFETPEEEEIDELIYDLGKNRGLDPVYMYFRYHGALPGPCIFNISIGNKYGNKKLYMNYYNDERERIDYYGYILTNSKGNFSVKLDHFSTYMLTTKKINGSEDRSNSGRGTNSTIEAPTSNKQHPNTGGR